jgi:hypothetical protein
MSTAGLTGVAYMEAKALNSVNTMPCDPGLGGLSSSPFSRPGLLPPLTFTI